MEPTAATMQRFIDQEAEAADTTLRQQWESEMAADLPAAGVELPAPAEVDDMAKAAGLDKAPF